MAKATGFEATEQEEVSQEQAATSLATISSTEMLLRDFGHKLPIGCFYESDRLADFTLKPYDGEEELAVSAIANRFQDRVADVLPHILAQVVDTIGGIPLKDLASSQSLSTTRLFENMFLADALTILLQLRLDNFGEEVKLGGQCPNCGEHNKDREGEFSDLGTVKVNVVEAFPHPVVEVLLVTGGKIFEDEVKRVLLRPVRVYDMKRLSKQDDKRTRLKLHHEILMHTVVAIPECTAYQSIGERGGLSPTSVEEIYKKLSNRDRDALIKAVSKLSDLGPEMTCEMICRACSYEFPAQVPWRDVPGFLSFPA